MSFALCRFDAQSPISALPVVTSNDWGRHILTSDGGCRRYWYTLYVLEAFLLVQAMYDILRETIAEYGYDDRFLNGLWLGLLGLETLMVLGVAVQGVVRRLQGTSKLKTT